MPQAPAGSSASTARFIWARPRKGFIRPERNARFSDIEGTNFGIELCFDGHFPELSTILALKGAEIIFIPHASPRESGEEKRERWLRYLSARAYDNSVFVVACNPTGQTENGFVFPGAAVILDPKGEVLASNQGEEEKVVHAALRKEALLKVRENPHGFFLNRRRPELYARQLR